LYSSVTLVKDFFASAKKIFWKSGAEIWAADQTEGRLRCKKQRKQRETGVGTGPSGIISSADITPTPALPAFNQSNQKLHRVWFPQGGSGNPNVLEAASAFRGLGNRRRNGRGMWGATLLYLRGFSYEASDHDLHDSAELPCGFPACRLGRKGKRAGHGVGKSDEGNTGRTR